MEDELPGHTQSLMGPRAEVWLGVAGGELDGRRLYFKQAYQPEGNLGQLSRMSALFSGDGAPTSGKVQTKQR